MVTSEYSMGSAPSALSMVRDTSARPRGGRPDVPAKMTSSILPPRSDLAPCSPMTHASASTTFDLPEPLGPTTQVTPGSKLSVVAEANDLNPRRVRVLRCTGGSLERAAASAVERAPSALERRAEHRVERLVPPRARAPQRATHDALELEA